MTSSARWATMAAVLALAGATMASAAEVEVVVPEASFPEGPLWHEGALYYVEYASDTVMLWDGKHSQEVWRQDGCGPSAVIAYGERSLLVTCYDANTLVEITSDGRSIATLSEDERSDPFLGPNDAVEDGKGGVYFSASGVWDAAAPIEGKIYYIAPDDTIQEVADHVHYANGLALAPDGGALYVSEMGAQRVLRFEIEDDGALGARYLFARLQDLAPDPEGADIYMGPDGLKTDSAGNLWIAQFEAGRVLVASPEAKLLETIDVPAPYVTNLTFGESENVLFVTAAQDAWNEPYPGQVYRIERR